MKYDLSCCALLLFAGLFSCSKKELDRPPDNRSEDPQLKVTHSIAALQAVPHGTAIVEDMVISGVVVMDDKSGNYSRKLVLEDSSGGIEVLIDQDNLYNDYPVGRKLYIRCKGLYTGAPGLNPQLGYAPDANGSLSAIPAVLADQYLVKGNYPEPLIPDTVTLAMLAMPDKAKRYLNTLVVIKAVQFADADTLQPYAQQVLLATATNRMIRDCNNGSIVMRSSGYARFQPCLTPEGNGQLMALYTRFNGNPQLCIRDTSDVRFYHPRCGIPPAAELSPISEIRALAPAAGDSVDILPVYKIAGVVISDRLGGNVLPALPCRMVCKVSLSGLPERLFITWAIRSSSTLPAESWPALTASYRFPMYRLRQYISSWQGVPFRCGTASIAELLLHYKDWESTLVRIPQAMIAAGGNYSGYKTLSDSTGSLTLYTLAGAAFAAGFVPVAPAGFTGILGTFEQSPQLQLRNINDVLP